jgi:cytochrome d ubiquinol oxidase subunit I
MQHPVAYRVLANGSYEVTSFWNLLLNHWALLQYAHNMSGAVIAALSSWVPTAESHGD